MARLTIVARPSFGRDTNLDADWPSRVQILFLFAAYYVFYFYNAILQFFMVLLFRDAWLYVVSNQQMMSHPHL